MIYSGLDIGTTGAKITVFNNCNELFKIYRKYPTIRQSMIDEVDVNVIFNAVVEIINEAICKENRLKFIGITSFGETFVLLDENDQILHNAMLYDDCRGAKEVNDILKVVSSQRVGKITGLKVLPMFSLPKLLYAKKHFKDFLEVKKICLIQDYVTYMLTGVQQIDYSLASRTMLFDINKKCRSDELFNYFGLDQDKFSRPVPTGTIAGKINERYLNSKNIDIKIINVSHDQIAAAVGAGLNEIGSAIDGTGTCECLIPLLKKVPDNKDIYEGGFGVIPYFKQGFYVSYPLIFSGGALIEWFVKNNPINNKNMNDYDYYESNMSDMPSNLLVYPHFLGSGTPLMNPNSKGLIYGLTVSTNKFDIYKGCLEGVAYEMLYNIEIFEKCGIKINKLYATGGGANNKKWLQIKADILNVPIIEVLNHDAGTVGTAIIVGLSIGLFKTYKEASKKLIKYGVTYMPDQEKHSLYNKLYEDYKRIYKILK